jgi:hypothetical protein
VLRGRPDWTAARIDTAMADTTTLKVRLSVRMLVAIVYATAERRRRGHVRFHPDVYGTIARSSCCSPARRRTRRGGAPARRRGAASRARAGGHDRCRHDRDHRRRARALKRDR